MASFSPSSRKNMLREAVLWWWWRWRGSASCTVAIRSQIGLVQKSDHAPYSPPQHAEHAPRLAPTVNAAQRRPAQLHCKHLKIADAAQGGRRAGTTLVYVHHTQNARLWVRGEVCNITEGVQKRANNAECFPLIPLREGIKFSHLFFVGLNLDVKGGSVPLKFSE